MKKEQNGRKSLRRLKATVGCKDSRRRRRRRRRRRGRRRRFRQTTCFKSIIDFICCKENIRSSRALELLVFVLFLDYDYPNVVIISNL